MVALSLIVLVRHAKEEHSTNEEGQEKEGIVTRGL